jgi:GTP-binding protein
LGDRFLGHVERCGALLHLVDGTEDDVAEQYTMIRGELEAYGHGLGEKPEVLALNKCDSLTDVAIAEKQAELEKISGARVLLLSGVAGRNVAQALNELFDYVKQRRSEDAEAAEPESAEAGGWSP